MLKVILNRLKPQTEKTIYEEKAGLRAGRSTTEQIFNLRIVREKNLQHQQNLYHVFINFKKAFDRLWHTALWAIMQKYNKCKSSSSFEHLYESDKAINAVQMNNRRRTVGDRQECLLSSTFFDIFSKGFCLMLWRNIMERFAKTAELLPICGLPMPSILLLKKSKN